MLSGFEDFEVVKMQRLGKRTVLHSLLKFKTLDSFYSKEADISVFQLVPNVPVGNGKPETPLHFCIGLFSHLIYDVFQVINVPLCSNHVMF